MLINLTDVFTSEDKEQSVSVLLEAEELTAGGQKRAVLKKSPVDLVLSNSGRGEAVVKVWADLTFEAFCDRCLKETSVDIQLSAERAVYSPEKERDTEEDDQPYMEGYQLNVETLVQHEVLLNWPMKILCKEDCKGVCSVCGRDLNSGSCGCDSFVPDPRMAVLKDIFNANKEV